VLLSVPKLEGIAAED
jgi:hypothetical protein